MCLHQGCISSSICAYEGLTFCCCHMVYGVGSLRTYLGRSSHIKSTACPLLTGCSDVQSEEHNLVLEGTNSYRRAIQYQQLNKLQQSSTGAHGFYVQVPASASAAYTQEYIWQTHTFDIFGSSIRSSAHACTIQSILSCMCPCIHAAICASVCLYICPVVSKMLGGKLSMICLEASAHVCLMTSRESNKFA